MSVKSYGFGIDQDYHLDVDTEGFDRVYFSIGDSVVGYHSTSLSYSDMVALIMQLLEWIFGTPIYKKLSHKDL